MALEYHFGVDISSIVRDGSRWKQGRAMFDSETSGFFPVPAADDITGCCRNDSEAQTAGRRSHWVNTNHTYHRMQETKATCGPPSNGNTGVQALKNCTRTRMRVCSSLTRLAYENSVFVRASISATRMT